MSGGIRIDGAVDEGGVQAAPTTPVHRLRAEVRRGEHRAGGQQRIGKFEQRIAAGAKVAVDGGTERLENSERVIKH